METRTQQLEQFIAAVKPNWFVIEKEINERINGLTMQLIAQECPETRGRIKALMDFKDLPTALTHELEAIKAELTS